MTALFLKFDIQHYWHIGSGEEGGAYADSLVLKDSYQLPFIPGKSVKGLLREAFNLAIDHGWYDKAQRDTLFGCEGVSLTNASRLHISSAILPSADYAHFVHNPSMTQALYHVIQQMSIDSNTGTTQQGSLRSTEVCVPMTLVAEVHLPDINSADIDSVEIDSVEESHNDVFEIFQSIVPLITHLGAKRHRGMGEVFVSVIPSHEICEA
ncbi:RAMP superfamily CRISPR-associated protein [Vibrio sp.]|nr:RAMP superfamily CRISPR-associated protein [Vibrio sp.]